MPDSRVDLRNPWLAALLAYLIPGAGHLYQRRFFKAVLYFVCIVATLVYGMKLGEWRVVYLPRDSQDTTYGYLAQILVGVPAVTALVQARRYQRPALDPQESLEGPISAPFQGRLVERSDEGKFVASRFEGRVEVEPVAGKFGGTEVQGTLIGTLDDEQQVELFLGGEFWIGPEIRARSERQLQCNVVTDLESMSPMGRLEGTIPRSFWNWFQVPLDNATLQDLNGRLGKRWELAKLFTWIAGLLNILAIWDALEGPAYGYGDDEELRRRGRRGNGRREDNEPSKPGDPDVDAADNTQAEKQPADTHAARRATNPAAREK